MSADSPASDQNRRLADCPASPNCVSSQASDPARRAQPFALSGSPAQFMSRIQSVVAAMPRTRVVEADDIYLHAEFKSALFGFVDDFEVLVDEAAGIAYVRSASRTGHWDMGANRRRVQLVRRRLEK
ncbi:MAG: DUF1499 domain-containing protein, partial [Gammaproteobacteria bacterium]